MRVLRAGVDPAGRTLLLDCGILLGLGVSRPARPPGVRPVPAAVGAAALAAVGLVAVFAWPPVAREFVRIDPSGQVGRHPDWFVDAGIEEQVATGNWVIILFRQSCDDCRDRLPGHLAAAAGHRVALLEVPPYGEGGGGGVLPAGRAVRRLDPAKTWVVRTPLVLWAADGVVTATE